MNLLQHSSLTGTALYRSTLNTGLEVKHIGNVLLEALVDGFDLLVRELVHRDGHQTWRRSSFETTGGLLLRHEEATGGVGIYMSDEADLGSRVDNKILGPSIDVLHQHTS